MCQGYSPVCFKWFYEPIDIFLLLLQFLVWHCRFAFLYPKGRRFSDNSRWNIGLHQCLCALIISFFLHCSLLESSGDPDSTGPLEGCIYLWINFVTIGILGKIIARRTLGFCTPYNSNFSSGWSDFFKSLRENLTKSSLFKSLITCRPRRISTTSKTCDKSDRSTLAPDCRYLQYMQGLMRLFNL